MGPYLIFDKSFLESLTVDEAVWLDNYFLNNVTPLFYVETLADLKKEGKKGDVKRTPEQLVGELATKSPYMNAVPASHHLRLVLGNLLGQEVSWEHHRPIIAGGKYSRLPDGSVTVDFDQFPEFAALERWKVKDFKTIEEKLARNWREILSNLTFDDLITKVEGVIDKEEKLSSMEDAFNLSSRLVTSKYNQFIYLALDILGIPDKARKSVLKRWHETRYIPFDKFAPYAAHVLKVDLFFYLCLKKSFISKERPSNKIDLAYLYYLPFCYVFTSRDKLHKRIVPFFLEEDQIFVPGDDLKADLKKINDYFSSLPEKIKTRGVYQFAHYPPYDIDTLVGKLHDKYLIPWREKAKNHLKKLPMELKTLKNDNKFIQRIKREQTTKTPYSGTIILSDKVKSMTVKKMIPVKRGSWFLLPPEIINKDRHG